MTQDNLKTPTLLLAAMSLIGHVALNVFSPLMPLINQEFMSSPYAIQLGITLFLLFFATGQLIAGVLADRFGRRNLLLAGFTIHILGCLLAIMSTNIWMLLFARILQALGASAGIVLTRTIILDQNNIDTAASKLSYITMGIATVQALAPTFSGYISSYFGWKAIFYLSFFFAFLIWYAMYYYLPKEQEKKESQTFNFQIITQSYMQVICVRRYLYLSLSNALISAALFIFVLNTPFIVQQQLGGTALDYANWFFLVALGFWLGSFLAGQMLKKLSVNSMMLLGYRVCILSAIGMLMTIWLFGLNYYTLFLPMASFTFGRGLSLSSAQAAAMAAVPNNKATAIGLFSFIQLVLGAFIAQISPLFIAFDISILPLSIIMLAFIAILIYLRSHKEHDAVNNLSC